MGQCRSPSVSPSRQPASSDPDELSLFEQYIQGGNPFEMQIDNKDEESEDVLASNGVGFLCYSMFVTPLLHMHYVFHSLLSLFISNISQRFLWLYLIGIVKLIAKGV